MESRLTHTPIALDNYPNITLREAQRPRLATRPTTSASLRTHTIATKKTKIPPIVSYGVAIKELTTALRALLRHNNFKFKKLNNNCTHILTETLGDYQKIRDLLTSKNLKYFTYTPKELKPVSLILRGVDSEFSEEEVKEAFLQEQPDLPILKISRYNTPTSSRMGKQLDLFLVQLKQSGNTKDLTAIKYLLNQRIQWENILNRSITQCRRCQRYGHISVNCNLAYRCVKCPLSHTPGQCNRTDRNEGQPYCVNCAQHGHPANFGQCPKYLEFLGAREVKKDSQRKPLTDVPHRPNNYANDNTPYSAALKNNTQQRTNNPIPTSRMVDFPVLPSTTHSIPNVPRTNEKNTNDHITNNLDFLNSQFRKYFNTDMMEFARKINQVVNFLKGSPDPGQAKQALFNFAYELAPFLEQLK